MYDIVGIPQEYMKELLDSILNDDKVDFYAYGNCEYEHKKFIKTELLPTNYIKLCEQKEIYSTFDRVRLGINKIPSSYIDLINNETYP